MDNLQELKNLMQWTNYILYPDRPGHFSKPPINPHTLRNGDSTDPTQWTDYQTARANVGKTATHYTAKKTPYTAQINGVGFITSNGYCGIDLDHVLEDGKPKAPFVEQLLNYMDTYSEISVSGTGLHLILHADLPEDLGGKFHVNEDGDLDRSGEYEVEIYAYRSGGGRYLTVSENPYQDKPINHNKAAELQNLYAFYRNAGKRNAPQPSSPPVGSRSLPERSDEDVLRKAFQSENGDKIRRLYGGDCSGYGKDGNDHSSADQALVNNLCYWTNGNAEQIDRIFRTSGLMRDKWDRPLRRGSDETYGQRTISKALENFMPYTPHERRSEAPRRESSMKFDNLYLDEAKASKTPQNGSQGDIPDPNNHNGNIGETYWDHWEYTRAVIMSGGTQTEYRTFADYKSAWNDIRAKDANATVTFYMLPSEGSKPSEASSENPQEEIAPLSYSDMVSILQNANDQSIEIPHFESFSKVAKIGQHDSVVIAGETGSGKSMIALNFMENLNAEFPVIYFNLEMTKEMVLRRIIAIHSGMKLDRVEGYKFDADTQSEVNKTLKEISGRKPMYVINDKYKTADIEAVIQRVSSQHEEPTVVFIDHTLLVKLEGVSSSYERFTGISEELRRIALLNNCIMFILTQQNRVGKANREDEPELSSLKESGSFENDATHVAFVWYSVTEGSYYLVLRKNRKGTSESRWSLDVNKETQTIRETSLALPLLSAKSLDINSGIILPEAKASRPTRGGKKKK